ncbi:MAG: spore coat protein [Christensenellales bacterium]
MNDKDLMEELLNGLKGAAGLYLHGTIESSTENVHSAFDQALDETLAMQNSVYNKMSEKGWYPMQNAPQEQINQVQRKFSN